MELEWDPRKADRNVSKHRISFEDAAQVFLDPRRIEAYDGRAPYGEDRWVTVGLVGPTLITVVYTLRGRDHDIIRLISARKADARERAKYDETHN